MTELEDQEALLGRMTAMAEGAPGDEILLQNHAMAARILGACAHDFNNILTGILGNLELLERRAAKAGLSQFVDYFAGAHSAASRGASLAARLMQAAGQYPLNPESLPVAAFLAEMQAELQTRLGGQNRLEISVAADAGQVFCDPTGLQDALRNLAQNAGLQMAPANGEARLAGRRLALSAAQAARLDISPGDFIEFLFTDSGPGMSTKTAALAFEPFFSTINHGAGSGLGLACVLGFARQSGGHAGIVSHAAGQMQVRLILPAG